MSPSSWSWFTRGRAVVISLLLGAALLLSAALPWLYSAVPTLITLTELRLPGSQALPAVNAAALVTAAAGIVIAIGGRVVRRLAALVQLTSAALIVIATRNLLADPTPVVAQAAAEITGVRDFTGPVTTGPGPYLALGLAVLLFLHGLLVLLGPGWQASARRFERAAAPSEAPATSAHAEAMDAWDALGRGEDPTAPEDR